VALEAVFLERFTYQNNPFSNQIMYISPSDLKNELIVSLKYLSEDDVDFFPEIVYSEIKEALKSISGFTTFLEYQAKLEAEFKSEDSSFISTEETSQISKRLSNLKANLNSLNNANNILEEIKEAKAELERKQASTTKELATLKKLDQQVYSDRIKELSTLLDNYKSKAEALDKKESKLFEKVVPKDFQDQFEARNWVTMSRNSKQMMLIEYKDNLVVQIDKVAEELYRVKKETYEKANPDLDWLHDISLEYNLFGESTFGKMKRNFSNIDPKALIQNVSITPPPDWYKKIAELAHSEKSELRYSKHRDKFIEIAMSLLAIDFSKGPVLLESNEHIYPFNDFLGVKIAFTKTGKITQDQMNKENLWMIEKVEPVEIFRYRGYSSGSMEMNVPQPLIWITHLFTARFYFFPSPGKGSIWLIGSGAALDEENERIMRQQLD